MRISRFGLAPLATVGFGIGFAIWTWLTFAGALSGLDALQAPPPLWQQPITQVAAAIAVVFHPLVVYTALAGIAVWALRRRLRNLAVAVVASILLGRLGHELLRTLLQRDRPVGSLPALLSNQG